MINIKKNRNVDNFLNITQKLFGKMNLNFGLHLEIDLSLKFSRLLSVFNLEGVRVWKLPLLPRGAMGLPPSTTTVMNEEYLRFCNFK